MHTVKNGVLQVMFIFNSDFITIETFDVVTIRCKVSMAM